MSNSQNLSDITESLKNKFKFLRSNFFIELIAYFIGGFVLGLILKYLKHYIFWFSILFVIVLAVLNSYGAISIDYNFFYHFFGINPDSTLKEISTQFFELVKAHIFQFCAALFGIFLAWEFT